MSILDYVTTNLSQEASLKLRSKWQEWTNLTKIWRKNVLGRGTRQKHSKHQPGLKVDRTVGSEGASCRDEVTHDQVLQDFTNQG